eukprot:TRINITY_DN41418_c0_g1_i1.p2 TRINITY_DN41418_c0_g1~~TRINITY_DN41418_c0_g1_i1.p2  ORF type:complete len:130 (-),score=28.48 TRINITY_DN41418_c0_g1_i1:28-387(-)
MPSLGLLPNQVTLGAALASCQSWQLAESLLAKMGQLSGKSALLWRLAARSFERASRRIPPSSSDQGYVCHGFLAEDLVDLRDLPRVLARAALRGALHDLRWHYAHHHAADKQLACVERR